jgi:hypothetical protein
LFSRNANEGADEEKKQAEVTSVAIPEWRRALGARAAAPHQAARVGSSTRRLTDARRADSGRRQVCAVAVLSALNESAVETGEAGCVQRIEQFGRRAALRKLTPNNECEKEERRKSDSGL